jgi:predicted aspartyl protease
MSTPTPRAVPRLALLALLALPCCETMPPLSRGAALGSVAIMLREGRIEPAVEQLARMSMRDGGDHELLQWNSVVAELLWRGDEAIRHQLAAVRAGRIAGVDGDTDAMLRGRLGDLLFQAGRYAEATAPLDAGAIGTHSSRRGALAAISRLLPFAQNRSGPPLTEQPLIGTDIPEFVCRAGELERSFTLDTGSTMTTLAAGLAAELGVRGRRRAGDAVDSTGRVVAVDIGVLGRFAVGDVAVGDVPVLVVADSALMLRDLHGGPERVPQGVLGLDLLSGFRLTLDPERDSLTLELPRGLPEHSSVQCVRLAGRCLLPVTIDGVRLWFVLDTGASHSSLTPEAIALLPGGRRAVPAFRRVRAVGGGLVAVRELRDAVLRVSAALFRGVTLPVVPRQQEELFPVHGVLGMDLLQRCRMTLDRGRALLEPPVATSGRRVAMAAGRATRQP